MAKVKFSALISEMRNKLNGSVFSKNRAGNYLRNKVTPVNPQTTFQSAVRGFLTAASQAWRSLTVAQRTAWSNAVANFTGTDIFGDVKTPSGSNLYSKLFINAETISGVPLNTPPPIATSPGIATEFVTSAAPGTFTVTDAVLAQVPAGRSLVVRATASVSAGKNFLKGKYRVVTVLPAATAFPYNANAPYATKFGAVVATEKIGWELYYIDSTTFIQGPRNRGANIN